MENELIDSQRLALCVALVILIFFLSTQTAGVAFFRRRYSEALYRSLILGSPVKTYRNLLLCGVRERGDATSFLHLIAEKGVHFLLFFALGTLSYGVARIPGARRVLLSVSICLIVGSASELLQRFTGRDPRISDVMLNASSGSPGRSAGVTLGAPECVSSVLWRSWAFSNSRSSFQLASALQSIDFAPVAFGSVLSLPELVQRTARPCALLPIFVAPPGSLPFPDRGSAQPGQARAYRSEPARGP